MNITNELLQKKLEREILARKEAENILESKAIELFNVNKSLADLNKNLDFQIAERTKELESEKHKAILAQEAEKTFLANMSHEIRTPLNAIIGMSHLLYDTKIDANQKELIDAINHSSVFLYNLISDILDISKLESGQVEIQETDYDFLGLMKVLQHTYELKLQKNKIEFELFLDSKLKSFYKGDQVLLNQVLHNLISNSEKFTPEGIIGLKVKLLKTEEDIDVINFEVYDTGIGIPEEKLEPIFDKFTQVRNEFDAKTKGSGLGLSICKEIITTLGGHIRVESKVGKGTKFIFEIPQKHSDKNSTTSYELKTEAKDNSIKFKDLNFLIVEDNVMNRKYVCTLFDNKKLKYEIAIDGEEAIEKCSTQKFDIILMDIQMPKKDGIQATLAIRNLENPNKNSIIIALTASALESQKTIALDAGMNDFLTKPFTPEGLFNKILKYLPESDDKEPLFNKNSVLSQHNNKENALYIINLFWDNVIQHEIIELNELSKTRQDSTKFRQLLHKILPTFSMVGLTEYYTTLNESYRNIMSEEDVDYQIKRVHHTLTDFFENSEKLKTSMLSI